MPNEFRIKNGFFSEGNSIITGSLVVTAGITGSISGSVTGTATTASYVLNAVSASFATSASRAISASFATSASWAPDTTFPYTGSAEITGSLGVTGSFGVQTYDATNTQVPALQITNGSRLAYDTVGTSSINWRTRVLYDPAEVNSIDWGQRQLLDSSLGQSADWNGRILNDSIGTYAIDWRNRLLYDSANAISVNWDSKELIDTSTGNPALSFDPANFNQNLIAGYYLRKTIPQAVQEAFSDYGTVGTWNADGEILDGITLDAGVSQFDLVALDPSGTWYQNTTGSISRNMLGICLDAGARPAVLIEGNILVTSNPANAANAPWVQGGLTLGTPIYIRDSGGEDMSVNIPTSTGVTVRVLGHAYYQNTNDTDYYIMKFKPSNDWYEI